MNTSAFPRSAASYALFSLLFAGTQVAAAGAQRTFGAGNGNDSNTAFNCSKANPCRTLQAALSVTLAGGQVYLLDPVGYGAATITQSVEIDSQPGVLAGITASSGTALTINAPGANVVVNNLTLTGIGATVGIDDIDSASLKLGNVHVSGFAIGVQKESAGQLFIDPSVLTGNTANGVVIDGGGNSLIKNSHIVGNGSGNPTDAGLSITGPGRLDLENVNLTQNNGPGLIATNTNNIQPLVIDSTGSSFSDSLFGSGLNLVPGANSRISVSLERSPVNGNQADGIAIDATAAGSGVDLFVHGSQVGHNGQHGVHTVGAGFKHRISHAWMLRNGGHGFAVDTMGASGGFLFLDNSTVDGNGGDGVNWTGAGGSIVVTANHFTNNVGQAGIAVGGTLFHSTGNNVSTGNGTNAFSPPGTQPLQ